MQSTSKLFQPIRVGDLELAHRVVFAPATRIRADNNAVPLPHVAEYYEQRASTPGSLLVSEATIIAARAGGDPHIPGIWSDEQISAWKKVTDRVHAKGSYMFLQIYALGRAGMADELEKDGFPYVSSSDVPMEGRSGLAPRPLTVEEIKEYLELYATAASNAVHKAGFDGVEIHAANGYLPNQFLNERSNLRTDAYGGSVENRSRFTLEVVQAVVNAVGQKKTAIRFSPWGTWQDMRSDEQRPTFEYLITELRDRYVDLAYLHLVEPRADGFETAKSVKEGHSNDFIRAIWGDRPLISAGGYTRDSAMTTAEKKGDLIAFARPYIANPDLPYRLLNGIALTVGNRALYYAPGSTDPQGFTDYPFASRAVDSLIQKLGKVSLRTL